MYDSLKEFIVFTCHSAVAQRRKGTIMNGNLVRLTAGWRLPFHKIGEVFEGVCGSGMRLLLLYFTFDDSLIEEGK